MDPNRLKTILSGARAVMDAVDTGNYQKGNIDPTALSAPDNLTESVPNMYQEPMMTQPMRQQNQPAYRNLHTTKMPKEIVQAMIEQPIIVPDSPYHTFELNEDFLREINPESVKQQPKQQKQYPHYLSLKHLTLSVAHKKLCLVVNQHKSFQLRWEDLKCDLI